MQAIYDIYGDLLTPEGANLQGANLQGANLQGANLQGANLRDVHLEDANLQGLAENLGIQVDKTLPLRIVQQIEAHPESWEQRTRYSECGTEHSIAGWAITLSGPLGFFLEKQWGPYVAAKLLLWCEGVEMPLFSAYATEEETLGRLRKMAESL